MQPYKNLFISDGDRIEKIVFNGLSALDMDDLRSRNGEFEVQDALSGKTLLKGDMEDIYDTLHDFFSDAELDSKELIPPTKEEIAEAVTNVLYGNNESFSEIFDDRSEALAEVMVALEAAEHSDLSQVEDLLDRMNGMEVNGVDVGKAVLDLKEFSEEFRTEEGKPENPLKKVEEELEENYNQIDGIINNLPPDDEIGEIMAYHVTNDDKLGFSVVDGENDSIVFSGSIEECNDKCASLNEQRKKKIKRGLKKRLDEKREKAEHSGQGKAVNKEKSQSGERER